MSCKQNKQSLFFLILFFTAFLPAPVKAVQLVFLGKPVVDIVNDLILFLLSIIGGVALLMLVFSGILYVFAGANPEAQTKAKKTFNYAIIGLILVLISYAVVKIITDISV